MAQDALATALAGYVHGRRDVPAPRPAADGQELIAVPPVTAAKLALYPAMRGQDVTDVELVRLLDVSEAAVRKLLNPDHRSHIGQVERALRAVGRTLIAEDRVARSSAPTASTARRAADGKPHRGSTSETGRPPAPQQVLPATEAGENPARPVP